VLAEMSISGLGVIDEATLELHPGFTVLTGETGAGKTMVVTGLHLLSGGRAEASRVRSGSQRAVVGKPIVRVAPRTRNAIALQARMNLTRDHEHNYRRGDVSGVNADLAAQRHFGQPAHRAQD